MVKNLPSNAGDLRDLSSFPELHRSPGGGHGNPSRILPHGQGILADYSPWGLKESDRTEAA